MLTGFFSFFSGVIYFIALYAIYPQVGVLKVFFVLLVAVSFSYGYTPHGSVREEDIKSDVERYKWDDQEEQIALTDHSLDVFSKQNEAEDDNALNFTGLTKVCVAQMFKFQKKLCKNLGKTCSVTYSRNIKGFICKPKCI